METEYIGTMQAEWGMSYRPLNTTGRWKIESCAYFKDMLFIEHKGLIFKSWISEDDIYLLPKESFAIFDCTGF